jgi:hypothetical protein
MLGLIALLRFVPQRNLPTKLIKQTLLKSVKKELFYRSHAPAWERSW